MDIKEIECGECPVMGCDGKAAYYNSDKIAVCKGHSILTGREYGKINQLESEADELRAMLARLESCADDERQSGYCPICGACRFWDNVVEHDPDCELDALINKK